MYFSLCENMVCVCMCGVGYCIFAKGRLCVIPDTREIFLSNITSQNHRHQCVLRTINNRRAFAVVSHNCVRPVCIIIPVTEEQCLFIFRASVAAVEGLNPSVKMTKTRYSSSHFHTWFAVVKLRTKTRMFSLLCARPSLFCVLLSLEERNDFSDFGPSEVIIYKVNIDWVEQKKVELELAALQ